ncbi:hypothetical protein [Glycomyces sp. YM15]|uniref:hypothetical protein n=1 Tax=Glycomyces sp. YM15 TaxID=2800446 RepID=UPI001962987A|nr:hypothetical protein [Glycomyces sp. YM15]
MARVSQWNWSDFSQEWSQTSAINDLDEELSAERRARTRQARRFEDAQQQLKQQVDSKLDSVSERIEAVLDWTELRFQQVEFDEYQARKAIRNTVRAIAEGRRPLLHGFEDVPGYWLPSAAAAVLPLVLRDRVPEQRSTGNAFTDLKTGLENARERDAVRTELFSLAVGRCFGQPAFIDAAVLRLLTESADLGVVEPGQVAHGWRTLWEQSALGAFGPGAEAQIASLLRERFDAAALDEETLADWDETIEQFGATHAEAFAALEAHFTAEPDPANRAAANAGEPPQDEANPDGTTAETGGRRRDEPPYDDTAWRCYLQELIEEPSPAELPIVRRMAELDPAPDGREADRRSWAAPAGTFAELVRRDLFDPEAPVPLRRLALDLTAPILRSRLDRLEASLGTTGEVTVTVRRRGEYIAVTSDGHDPEQFAAVERRVDQAFAAAEPSKPLAIAIAASLGLLGVLMILFGQWFAAVLFAAAAIIPIWKYRGDAGKATKDRARRDDQLAEIRTALVKARKDAERQEREATEHGLATGAALERLREALPAEPTPNALSEPGPDALNG